jgi:LasA protease
MFNPFTRQWALSCACVAAVIGTSLPSAAVDLHGFQPVTLNPVASTRISIPLMGQISNTAFVDGPETIDFSWQEYLEQQAPHLLEHAELLSHWAGVASINPKLVITLMEFNSQVITEPITASLENPFNTHYQAEDFNTLIATTLLTISDHFYQARQQQSRSPDRVTTSAATLALLSLKPLTSKSNSLNASQWLNELMATYERLFPGEAVHLSLHSSSIPEQDGSEAEVPPRDMMQMPWRQGYSWKPNGAHSNTGSGYPLSSMDVSYNWPRWGRKTYSVTAAHEGKVKVYSRCNVRITHSKGWQTNYYHMEGIQVSNGEKVSVNSKLGVYANDRSTALCEGGSSTGPHLHFSLLYKGYYQSLQGVNLGPYVINVGNYSYDDNCNRYWLYHTEEDKTYCAWNRLYNPGPLSGKATL